MKSLTIRGIPKDLAKAVKDMAHDQRRSMNQQFLVVMEAGLKHLLERDPRPTTTPLPKEVRTRIWQSIAGKWEDSRSTQEIIEDIVTSRTLGREFEF